MMFSETSHNGAILIVDDNPTNLEVLSHTLNAAGLKSELLSMEKQHWNKLNIMMQI